MREKFKGRNKRNNPSVYYAVGRTLGMPSIALSKLDFALDQEFVPQLNQVNKIDTQERRLSKLVGS